ncbi:metal-binding protein ZinT [Paracoccus caeni]|uniref:Metal-binding protein ZinT n=1 Tax=Paracoccus caeni TaxID=657651 RepID=A0A934SG31_9RHOB|nr:metal-binding protein ZinT [Paracoccus caeni]MBK4214534.1 metal-binding protein ZinT [Paracoccus caeni]
MQKNFARHLGALALGTALAVAAQTGIAMAETAAKHDHAHDHAHDHSHDTENNPAKGYFEDAQVQPRDLSDWEGDWQSVYPYLADGTLDPVMEHKAEHGDKTAEEYRAYYETGYKTDVDRITIEGNRFDFYRGEEKASGEYESGGYEILNYAKGNRGVRFIFEKVSGDEAAPKIVQFSDHIIAPQKSGHFHLYWGDDRAAVLEELTNWPTYYPSNLDADGILHEMLAH